MRKFAKISLLFMFANLACSLHIFGQTNWIPMAGETETFTIDDGDFFYDPGGIGTSCIGSGTESDGFYPNCGCISTTTLCAPAGAKVEVTFTTFLIFGSFDWLNIYDGTNNGDPLIYASNIDGDELSEMMASVGNTFISTGTCLTFEFNASNVVNRCGWEANLVISGGNTGGTGSGTGPCAFACNDINVNLQAGECEEQVSYGNILTGDCSGIFIDYDIPTGSAFSIGSTMVTASAEIDGEMEACTFDVQVNEYPDPIGSIACNDVQISLDENCEATLEADLLLEGGPYGCYENFTIMILEYYDSDAPVIDFGPNPELDVTMVGMDITYKVVSETENSCWGLISVEDKTDPIITCPCETEPADCEFVCTDLAMLLEPGNGPQALATDACDGILPVTYFDEITQDGGDCGTTLITRTFNVVDLSENNSTCSVVLTIEPVSTNMIVFPVHYDGQPGNNNPLFCLNANTDPINTGVPTINNVSLYDVETNQPNAVCGITANYSDQLINICDNGLDGTYQIIRTWVITEWCNGEDPQYHIQVIKVEDNNSPNFGNNCPGTITVSVAPNTCLTDVNLPNLQVFDLCSSDIDIDITTSNGILNEDALLVEDLPLGMHTVTYTATDACGNSDPISSICTFMVNVKDNVNPTPACEGETVIPIAANSPVLVNANSFDDGSYDNCGSVSFLAKRLDNPNCVGNDETAFESTVPFSCCDVGMPVIIFLQIEDESGNISECMVEAIVQDDANPVIEAPADQIYNCEEENPLDNSYFISDDPTIGPATYFDGIFVGYYSGYANDNCEVLRVDYTESVITAVDCGVGEYERCFTATDVNNQTSFQDCHTISIENIFPFSEQNITWPSDLFVNTCNLGLDPTDLEAPYNEPVISNVFCTEIASFHEDIIAPIQGTACLTILRTWTIRDWCQYDSSDPNSGGEWSHMQIIQVENSEPPIITSPCTPQSYCSNSQSCSVASTLGLVLSATDDCTALNELIYFYEIDLNNDGSFAQAIAGTDANGSYPLGEHTIRWTVLDGCGNETTCEYQFSINDCTPPTVYGQNGLAVNINAATNSVTIWASDFDQGSNDNCDPDMNNPDDGNGICAFSIQSPSLGPGQDTNNPPSNTSLTLTCDDLTGGNPTYVTVDFWAMDCHGNWAYTSTYILLEDNNSPLACPDAAAMILGDMITEEGDNIAEVKVNINGSIPGLPNFMVTGVGGNYEFPGMAIGGTYMIKPEKNVNPLNGVSTYDLVLLSQHILNMDENPLGPYKKIAADVNNSKTITTFDMVEIRQLILFISTDFPNNESWRFVDASYSFPPGGNPFTEPFPEADTISPLMADTEIDFVGVKIGDLNCSNNPSFFVASENRNTEDIFTFSLDDIVLETNEEYTISFKSKALAEILGMQFTLEFDQEKITFLDIEPQKENWSRGNFGFTLINEGIITASWDNAQQFKLQEAEPIFDLKIKVKETCKLSEVLTINSRYTRAEAYLKTDTSPDVSFIDINLEFVSEQAPVIKGNEFELYQNRPNPFKGQTLIGFNLPQAGRAELTIYDISGKILKVILNDFSKGYNEVYFDRSELNDTGVYYYQLSTPYANATRKMILVD